VVRDLDTLGTAVHGLAELRSVVASVGQGQAIGADRGRLNTEALARTGAEELLRQGFARVVWVDVYCSRHDGSNFDYSVSAGELDVGLLVTTSRDSLTGVSLDGMMRTEIELVNDATGLRPALLSALARLLGAPYARINNVPKQTAYHKSTDFEVEAYRPDPADRYPAGDASTGDSTVEVAIRRMDPQEAARLCEQIATLGALRNSAGPKTLNGGHWQVMQSAPIPTNAEPQAIPISLLPVNPGSQLLAVRMKDSRGNTQGPASYACVDVKDASATWWLDAAILPWAIESWSRGHSILQDARNESYEASLFTAGLTFHEVPVGMVAGYFHADRSGSVPPSWDDFRSSEFSPAGLAPYTVHENGLLAGFAVVPLDYDLCRASESIKSVPFAGQTLGNAVCDAVLRRFGFLVRVLLFGDATFVSLSPGSGLSQFGASQSVKLDAGILLEGGLRIHVFGPFSAQVTGKFGTLHLADLFAASTSRLHSDAYDGRFVGGLGLGVQGDL
jgi:hypothetical protein